MPFCDRCGRILIRDADEAFCLVHGARVTPTRAHERIAEEPIPDRRPGERAPANGRRWTPEERAWIVRNRNGMSSKQMAARLGRSEHAINQVLSKLGKRKRRAQQMGQPAVSAYTLSQLEDDARPGMLSRAARRMGMTRTAAYFRLYRRGVRLRAADGMLSAREAADFLAVDKRRVIALIAAAELPAERVGRFYRIDPADLERVAHRVSVKSKYTPKRYR